MYFCYHKRKAENYSDLSFLGSRLGFEEIWSNLNDKKHALLKKSLEDRLTRICIFIHIHLKNKII